MKQKYSMRNKIGGAAMASGLLALASPAIAADIDVVATQLAFNATYGLNTLAANTTWTADNVYILTDRVYVPAGVTLTIEPGTKIYSTFDNKGTTGETETVDDTVGALIIARGASINAQGTAACPIVFDAIQALEAERGTDLSYDPDAVAGPAPTRATRGLWGGVIILGNASISLVDAADQPVRNDLIEGFTPASAVDSDSDGFSDILEYGYDGLFAQDDADNSGVFSYVSISHGGYNFSADNEINGLTLGGVGSGTTINHVEVIANNDDGVEFFGGTVNTDHMVVGFCRDDAFDIDQGHSGTHQFWFAIQDPQTGDNLGEWDGVDTNVIGADKPDTFVQASNPQIWNATLVGPGASNVTPATAAKDNGLYLDDNFKGALRNSIIHDSAGFLASFASDGAFGAAGSFANNIVGTFGKFAGTNDTILASAPVGFYADLFGAALDGNTDAGTYPLFSAYNRDGGTGSLVSIDPRPTSLNTTVSAGAPVAANYRGAFDGTTNWAAGWTTLSKEGVLIGEAATGSFADADGDGVSDALENANTDLGFNAGINDAASVLGSVYTAGQVTADPSAFGLYDETSILDLRTVGQTMVQKVGGNVTLTVPVEKSTGLNSWAPAGDMTLGPFTGDPTKEFYRLKVEGAQ